LLFSSFYDYARSWYVGHNWGNPFYGNRRVEDSITLIDQKVVPLKPLSKSEEEEEEEQIAPVMSSFFNIDEGV
jgi:hypothetical protein